MCKHLVLLEKIVFKYHTEFHSTYIRDFAMRNPKAFNIEHLIEETISIQGGLTHTAKVGFDLTSPDGIRTEVKTSSMQYFDSRTGARRYYCDVANLKSKVGDVRLVIWNEYDEKSPLSFFYIPLEVVREFSHYRASADNRFLKIAWGKGRQKKGNVPFTYNRLEPFRVNTFEELCSL